MRTEEREETYVTHRTVYISEKDGKEFKDQHECALHERELEYAEQKKKGEDLFDKYVKQISPHPVLEWIARAYDTSQFVARVTKEFTLKDFHEAVKAHSLDNSWGLDEYSELFDHTKDDVTGHLIAGVVNDGGDWVTWIDLSTLRGEVMRNVTDLLGKVMED